MRPFEDEVNEIMIHYHDVARAHGMDRALREAVESNVYVRRECAGLRRRVEELEAERDALEARLAERDALEARLADVFGHKWRPSERTTPSGKILYECEVCGLEDPAPVKVEFESRPCWSAYKWLRARLAEAEAQATAMREVLQDALPVEESGWWCPTCKREVPGCDVTSEEYHDVCGTYIGNINSNEWRRRARAALSSSAGRDTAERLRLKAALEALKGGQNDAGTQA